MVKALLKSPKIDVNQTDLTDQTTLSLVDFRSWHVKSLVESGTDKNEANILANDEFLHLIANQEERERKLGRDSKIKELAEDNRFPDSLLYAEDGRFHKRSKPRISSKEKKEDSTSNALLKEVIQQPAPTLIETLAESFKSGLLPFELMSDRAIASTPPSTTIAGAKNPTRIVASESKDQTH